MKNETKEEEVTKLTEEEKKMLEDKSDVKEWAKDKTAREVIKELRKRNETS